MFPLLLSPNKDGVLSPLLSTFEIRDVFNVEMFGEILSARSGTLRIKWSAVRVVRESTGGGRQEQPALSFLHLSIYRSILRSYAAGGSS